MLELIATPVSVVACHASAEAADVLMGADASACRVAPDEVMLMGVPGGADELVASATETALAVDPDAAILDATDGWAVWTLRGDDARVAFGHLSAVELPDEGFAQGDVAHVPARILTMPDRLWVLVPAMWGEHLREWILADCSSLGVREGAEPAPWTSPAGGSR